MILRNSPEIALSCNPISTLIRVLYSEGSVLYRPKNMASTLWVVFIIIPSARSPALTKGMMLLGLIIRSTVVGVRAQEVSKSAGLILLTASICAGETRVMKSGGEAAGVGGGVEFRIDGIGPTDPVLDVTPPP